MGDIVNLRNVRKRAERARADRGAAANRLKFGRSKTQRSLDSSRDAKVLRDLDRHRLQTGDQE